MNILDKNSLRLSVLDDALINDEVFATAALQLLATENPLSTYTKATAGMGLINHLMVERVIDCYERGQFVDAASGTIFPDANGDYGTAINLVNHSRYIDAAKLSDVLKKLALPLPKVLQDLTPQAHPQVIVTKESSQEANENLTKLFDPVGKNELDKMFPSGKWILWADKARANGLISARVGRGKFNPYLAAIWWLDKQEPLGWDLSRCQRVLAKNLPARSKGYESLLTWE